MVMQVIRNSTLARGVGAWESVKNDWQGLQGPRGVTQPLSDKDVKSITKDRELAHKIKSAVAPIQKGREHL